MKVLYINNKNSISIKDIEKYFHVIIDEVDSVKRGYDRLSSNGYDIVIINSYFDNKKNNDYINKILREGVLSNIPVIMSKDDYKAYIPYLKGISCHTFDYDLIKVNGEQKIKNKKDIIKELESRYISSKKVIDKKDSDEVDKVEIDKPNIDSNKTAKRDGKKLIEINRDDTITVDSNRIKLGEKSIDTLLKLCSGDKLDIKKTDIPYKVMYKRISDLNKKLSRYGYNIIKKLDSGVYTIDATCKVVR